MMIIWINGAFGSGKTTVAEQLEKELAGSMIYDPEIVGDTMTQLIPDDMKLADFQDYPIWRQWNKQLLKEIYFNYPGDIIVPMTIYKKEYVEEIIESLEDEGLQVAHLLLEVTREEIIERLKKRNDGTLAWGESKVDDILAGFKQLEFTEIIPNHEPDISQVIMRIKTHIRK
ncbi:tunicamycin resistance protein [Enterococcus sp. JM4C]|nr:tunicamycin resistance protein [Enterococcus sp. JM4C]